MVSYTEENYLKSLFLLSQGSGEVGVNELSQHLGIKMPTVNSMMKKLREKKLVVYEAYKPLKLTARGKKEAGLIVRKHRLTEMFLVDIMGFTWDKVHEIAEQVEHIASPEFFDRMDSMLGHPTVDPHGSPIPDKNGNLVWKQYRSLLEVPPGETVKLCAVINSSDEFLRFLNSRNLQLGTKIKVVSVESFDQSMRVSYTGHSNEMLSKIVCEKLLVE